MADLATLVVKLLGDATSYKTTLEKAETDAKSFSSRVTTGFANIGGGLVTLMAGAAGAALVGMGIIGKSALDEAMNAEEVQSNLNAALANTGGITGVTSKMVDDLANHWQNLTRYEDEQIKSGGAVIAGFKQINSSVFPDALRLSLDLATKWKTDVPSAATVLAKALADPGVGLMKLKSAGVVFTDEQDKMIASMQKAGDMAGAQAIIMDVVNKAVGGSAEAAGKTAAGTWERLRNIWSNVLETLGTGLLPTITNVGQALATYLAKPETQAFIGMLAQRIAEFAQAVVNYFPQVVQWFQTGFGWLQQNQGVIVAALAVIGAAILAWVYTVVIPAAIAVISALWPVILIIALIGAAAYLIYQAWTTNWGGIQEKTAAVIAWMVQAFNDVITTVMAIWNNPLLQLTIQTILTNIKLIMGAFQAAANGDWTRFGEMLRMVWDNTWRMIGIILSAAWTNIKQIVSTLITNIIDFFKNTDWGAVGHNILVGIANGITSSVKWIVDAARSAAKAAMDAAKGFLGIRSPSKEAELQIGLPFGQGVGLGVEKSLGVLSGNMPSLFSGLMKPAFANATSGIGPNSGGGMGGGITIQIVNPTFFGTDQYEAARVLEPAVDLLLRRKGLK